MTKLFLPVTAILLMLGTGLAETCHAQGFGGLHRDGSRNRFGLSGSNQRPSQFNLTNRYTNEFSSRKPSASPYAPRDRVTADDIMAVTGDRPPGTLDIGEDGMPLGEAMNMAGTRFPMELETTPHPVGPPASAYGGLPSDVGMPAVGPGPFGPDVRGLGPVGARRAVRRGVRGGIGPGPRRGFGRGFRRGPHFARGFYSPAWYGAYPGAWYPGPAAWANNGTPWVPPEWELMKKFMGIDDAQPRQYEYGKNVTYQDNSVYVDGDNVGSADEFYQQAQGLADTGSRAATPDGQKWMPLGVFTITREGEQDDDMVVQLAVNPDGVIRGNLTSTLTNDTRTIQGSVDKSTQRVAFTITGNPDNVAETSLDNLTKDKVPLLIHYGQERTEQRVLVRLDESEANASDDTEGDSDEPTPAPSNR